MGKQQKSKNPERKSKVVGRKSTKEVLKKPKGMCKVDFKDMASSLAFEIRNRVPDRYRKN